MATNKLLPVVEREMARLVEGSEPSELVIAIYKHVLASSIFTIPFNVTIHAMVMWSFKLWEAVATLQKPLSASLPRKVYVMDSSHRGHYLVV